MKIEKKKSYGLFCLHLGYSPFVFQVGFSDRVRPEKNCSGIIRSGAKQKELKEGEIKAENIALPKDFDVPKSILFKTTHTIAEVWLDGEKIYEYGNEADAPGFMKTPGSCWHIVDIPGDSSGKKPGGQNYSGI